MKNSHTVLKYFLLSLWAFLLFFIGVITIHPSHPPCVNIISCAKDVSGDYRSDLSYATYMGNTYPVPAEQPLTTSHVLGDTTTSDKRIEIDLTHQELYAVEGNKMVYDFLISSGKWRKTPTGTYHIWIKLRYTNIEGGTKGTSDYYNLPNVPYTMYFYNDEVPRYVGYGIYGDYWNSAFGHPTTHGGISMHTSDAETLYNWVEPTTQGNTTFATDEDPGTEVIIYGETP